VYTSNESQQDVLFDNLGVLDITGPVLEETHYYPFGLTMSGISTAAPLKLANNYKFNSIELNNKEFSDGSGLNLYTAKFRGLDPQIGRWWQIDPRPDYTVSPYATMGLNPVLNSDLLGDTIIANTNGQIINNTGGNDDFIKTTNPLPTVTVTTNNNSNNSIENQSSFTAGFPIAIGYGNQPIDLPKIKIPKIEISLPEIGMGVLIRTAGTIGLVLLPVNWNQPSSDHLPIRPIGFIPLSPPIPKAEDLPWTPGKSPGAEWEWKGKGTPESGLGNWVNPNGQKLHPDLQHPDPKGPHWGLKQPDGSMWDIFPDGRVEPN